MYNTYTQLEWNYQAEYEDWLEIAKDFAKIINSSSSLFSNSKEFRENAKTGLTTLSSAYQEHNFNADYDISRPEKKPESASETAMPIMIGVGKITLAKSKIISLKRLNHVGKTKMDMTGKKLTISLIKMKIKSHSWSISLLLNYFRKCH